MLPCASLAGAGHRAHGRTVICGNAERISDRCGKGGPVTEEVRTTLVCLETEEGEENSETEGADNADDASKEGHQDDSEVDEDGSDDDGDGLQEGPDELAVDQ